ncbi:hypothetical protein [Fibrobacter sp. UWR2]|uniref:hypothetical protein n=1 Tax=Fibrobacter sp. UWR2 TaxID=1964352 RepID=UPI000B525803|nr:hypothetical protein [Fibrobacter sp. UWR2]OWU99373.1 hypothetical protein B7994_11775 [Fibrobacter sp. UWR2]
MKQELFKLIRKHRFNISIYTSEIFERRCQEEIIRSDEDKSSFVYLEFDFAAIRKILKTEEESTQFWDVFLTALNKNNRGSDIIGFLENEAGLGMLLLDSKIEGWIRVRGRILQTADSMGCTSIASVLSTIVKPIVYPTCISDAQDLNAITAISQELANSADPA